ncbi:MAG: hypothetical protein SFW64_00945 [Alphaproteobacteria bacterium]|nr:hypothetical protein [Alphaproteobacteria bacterium]
MDDRNKIPEILTTRAPRPMYSTILNGIGNGAMIGSGALSIPIAVKKLLDHNYSASHNHFRLTMVAVSVGSLLGGFFSYREAKELDEYRTALAEELEKLHARTDGKEAALAR